ncbi:MAG: hypothetical protein HOQ24_08775 [Mycobacteriaceae bacterium]|nr:hypothetical protein [Mycobacteriaceae bacterium]
MGMDAYVPCRCWGDGLASPPPVPREWVELTETGEVQLATPELRGEAEVHAFDRWQQGEACSHRHMAAEVQRIGNWGGYRAFQEALELVGAEHFPVLGTELPQSNAGSMNPDSAALALGELAYFREHAHRARQTRLLDDMSGECLTTYIAAYEGIAIWDGSAGRVVGVDPDGFFVREADVDRFRAMRLIQEPIGPGLLRLVDLDRPAVATELRSEPFHFGQFGDYSRRLRVETVPVDADEYDYALDGLAAVCHAAVQTRNHVIWC